MILGGYAIREDMYILVSAPGSWPKAYKTLVNFLSDETLGASVVLVFICL